MWNSRLLFVDSDETMPGKECGTLSSIRGTDSVSGLQQYCPPVPSPSFTSPAINVPLNQTETVVMETVPTFVPSNVRFGRTNLVRPELTKTSSITPSPMWSTRRALLPPTFVGKAHDYRPVDLESKWHQMPSQDGRPQVPFSLGGIGKGVPNMLPDQPEKVCNFCKRNGEMKRIYQSHKLLERGRVACPVLRRYVCPLCGATGDGAHTLSYCPLGNGAPSVATARTPRKSCGCKRLCRHGEDRHH